jgi:hypothetical protein
VKILRTIVMVSGSAAALGLLGCDVLVSGRPRHSDPVIVEQEPAYVIVTEAPPAPLIVQRRPPAPAREYVWIESSYAWNGRQYVAEPGRWAAPPRSDVVWVDARYDHDPHGYRYTPGHWRSRNGPGEQAPHEPKRD